MNAFKFGTIVQTHDLDYERLWNSLNRTDRSIIMQLTRNTNPLQNRSVAASTTFSALKRLQKNGIIIRQSSTYTVEDPFFCSWLMRDRNAV